MEEDGINDNEFFEYLEKYDTDEYLLQWYGCFEKNPFNIDCLSNKD